MRNRGTSTEKVRNCVPDGKEPIVKIPSRSIAASHDVEWSVSGETGVGVVVGGGVLPGEVNISSSLEATYGHKLGDFTQRGTGWQLPAKPGTIVTYILEWAETWQPGYVEVRFFGQPITKVDVIYRTGITSEIIAEDVQICNEGSLLEIEKGEAFVTAPALPTSTPIAIKSQQPDPAPRPIITDEAWLRPNDISHSPPTEMISILADQESGVRFNVTTTGLYKAEYAGGAYSPWPNDSYQGNQGWTTTIKIYINRPVEWGMTEYGLIGPINHDNYFASTGYYLSKEEATANAKGDEKYFRLKANDYLTLVALDEKGQYYDNRGKIDIRITYSGD